MKRKINISSVPQKKISMVYVCFYCGKENNYYKMSQYKFSSEEKWCIECDKGHCSSCCEIKKGKMFSKRQSKKQIF